MGNTPGHINHARRSRPTAKEPHTMAAASSLPGRWDIVEMSEFDRGNRAYITIKGDGTGVLVFGLTRGSLDGSFKKGSKGGRFDFTWEGSEDGERSWGDGWMRMADADTAEGEISFHAQEASQFRARRCKDQDRKEG